MGGRGPAPSGKRTRERDNPPIRDLSDEEPDAKQGKRSTKPRLPASYMVAGERVTYLAITRAKYRTWANSEQSRAFTPTDWLRLADIAPLWDQYARTGDPKLMSEIRLNEAKLGATPEDRQRLHWRIDGDAVKDAKKAPRTPSRAKGDPRKADG